MLNAQKKSIKREYSAGGVVFKKDDGKVYWLITQPNSDDEHWRQGRWQLPKGWIDEGETGQLAAIREVKEEGGVKAEIVEKIDRINLFFYDEKKQKVLKNVVFFLMEYRSGSEKDHDQEVDKAVWLPYQEAYESLTFRSEKGILAKARAILEEKERQPRLI